MGRPQVYYAELNLNGGKIIMRMQDEVRLSMKYWSPYRHSSIDYELHVLAEGTAALHLEHTAHTVTAGQAVLIPPQTIHFSDSYSDDMLHLYVHFQVKGQSLQELLCSAVGVHHIFPVKESTILLVRQLLQTLCDSEFYR